MSSCGAARTYRPARSKRYYANIRRSHDAAVFAIASEEWGETVGAAVVLEAAQRASVTMELQSWVRARLRGSRVPERVMLCDQLPYNDMGKLLRRELRREFGG